MRLGLEGSTLSHSLSITCENPSLFKAATGSDQLAPPSLEVESASDEMGFPALSEVANSWA
jgi:hypothetical protein